MTCQRNKDQDRRRTKERQRDRTKHRNEEGKNWLGHNEYSGAAQLDELLLDGATMEKMINKTGRKTESSVRSHLFHLVDEHGLSISKDKNDKWIFG